MTALSFRLYHLNWVNFYRSLEAMRYLSIIGLLFSIVIFNSCRTRRGDSSLTGLRHAKSIEHCTKSVGVGVVTCTDGSQELRSLGDIESGNYCNDFGDPMWIHAGYRGAKLTPASKYWASQKERSCTLSPYASARIISARRVEGEKSRLVKLKLGAVRNCSLVTAYVSEELVNKASVSPKRRPFPKNWDASYGKRMSFSCRNIDENGKFKYPGYRSYY